MFPAFHPRRFFATALLLSLPLTVHRAHAQETSAAAHSSYNTATGIGALTSVTTGHDNTADGFNALKNDVGGSNNTATGFYALSGNHDGGFNTATGANTLQHNTSGAQNTALGGRALLQNTTGMANVATGYGALGSNVFGNYNTADGHEALFSNTTSYNTATGVEAMRSTTTGSENTATGAFALHSNTDGHANAAYGLDTLFSNTGSSNTAFGHYAMYFNTTGERNVALGESAGFNLTTGSDNIEIGNEGKAGEHSTIRIGYQNTQTQCFIAGIYGTVYANGTQVFIDANGHLGTVVSSQRFKDDIHDMSDASVALLALRPVEFKYKKEFDPQGAAQFGLVAEEVEKVNPALVVHDPDGKPYSVRYEQVNAMLLNEFLKEHAHGQAQDAAISRLEAALARQQAQIDALTTHPSSTPSATASNE